MVSGMLKKYFKLEIFLKAVVFTAQFLLVKMIWKTASVITKEFEKTASSHHTGCSKAAGADNFWKLFCDLAGVRKLGRNQ
jgi:hypothetical protein